MPEINELLEGKEEILRKKGISEKPTNADDNPEEEKPEAIVGGLKIWCKKEDKRKVLDIISKHSTIDGVLADESMFETAGRMHIDFSLTQIYTGSRRNRMPTGRYRLSSKRFNLQESIKELEVKKISHVVDMETGKPVFAGIEGMGFYPISQGDIDFKVEETKVEEEKDELEEFAEGIKL